LKVNVFNFPGKSVRLVAKAVGAVLRAKNKVLGSEINLVMVSDREIRRLNRAFRRVDRVTDVISFRLSKKPLSGDIYISRGRSARQAKEVGNSWEEELCYLALHGTLHLFDYTDYTPAEKKKMFAVQDMFFNKVIKP
jgi:probable rRNA maturation factor